MNIQTKPSSLKSPSCCGDGEGSVQVQLDPKLKIANRYGFRGTPYTVVVNKKGEIVARIHGRTDEARLARVLDPLVKPPPVRKPPARLQ